MLNETNTPSPRTAFISGPIEPGVDYFHEHYEPLIRDAISAGDSFVMGPAPGMDTMGLQFLLEEKVHPSRITVYLSEFQEFPLRDLKGWFEGLGGNVKVEGVTTSNRDAAMTRDSDYDILRYMSVEEQKNFYGARYFPRVSATEKNERRRLGLPLHVNHAYELEIQSDGPITRKNIPSYVASGSNGGDLLDKWKQGIKVVLDKISSKSKS
jgi:hypothetical protein